jgi:hypothetical protein
VANSNKENERLRALVKSIDSLKIKKCEHCSNFDSLDGKSIEDLDKLSITLSERLFAVQNKKSEIIEEQRIQIRKLQKQVSDGHLCVICQVFLMTVYIYIFKY